MALKARKFAVLISVLILFLVRQNFSKSLKLLVGAQGLEPWTR
jgi:hypothetical protein